MSKYKNYLIIIFVCILAIILCYHVGYLSGSTTDWISQHIVFPEYFRNLFYSSHQLFPSYAFNIGAGENIFNFSYYGLFNPIFLISYLLPFVSMVDYVTISSIFLFIASGILSYKWFSSHKNEHISLLLSIIFILSSPLLYQFHRHFMFVSYFPFLFLALIGVDKYIEKNKSLLLIFSLLLIILMSYYYSVSCILVVILYYIYRRVNVDKVNFKKMLTSILKFFIPIIISILIASFLLLPTFFALLSGRDGGSDISILELLIPKINIDSIVYDNYSVGLSAIGVLSVIMLFNSKSKNIRFLSIALFVIISSPLIIYLLNGMLYVRDKVFIPFLPLFVLLIGEFLESIFDKKIKLLQVAMIFVYTSILFLIFGYHNLYYYIDALLIVLLIFLYYKFDKKIFIILYLIIVSFVNFYISNMNEKYVKVSSYENLNSSKKYSAISDVVYSDNDIYRFNNLIDGYYSINKIYDIEQFSTSVYSSSNNSNYSKFYVDIFKNNIANRNNLMLAATPNILFNTFMGVKYIYSDYDIIGYEKIGDNIYKNDNVLPLFYLRSDTLKASVFDEIPYPYNVDVLLNNVIVDNSSNDKYVSNIEKYELKYSYDKVKNLDIKFENNKYYIDAKKDVKLRLKLDDVLENKLLLIDFKVNNQHSCDENDSEIKINNVVNKLTCKREFYLNNNYVFHYVISDKKIEYLDISIKKGLYIIDNINTYIMNYLDILDIDNYTKVDNVKYDGNSFDIDVDVGDESYFVTSLPYDDSFIVYVDGVLCDYEKINKAFLGFKIKSGKHNIKISYISRGLRCGMILSVIGIISLILYIFIKKKLDNNNNL